MNTPNEPKSFFDRRTILAVVLVGGLFFGWQKYLEHKYADFYKSKEAVKTETATTPGTTAPSAPAETSAAPAANVASTETAADNVPESKITLGSADLSFDVSSKGMGLQNVTVLNYTDREKKPVQLGVSKAHGLYEISLAGSAAPLNFALTKVSDSSVKGIAKSGTVQIEQTLVYDAAKHAIHSEISITGAQPGFPGFAVMLPEEKHHEKDGTFFLPSIEHQEFVFRTQGKLERVNASSKKEDVVKDFDQVSMAAVGSQYFVTAYLDQSEISPKVHAKAPVNGDLTTQLVYAPATVTEKMNFKWTGYAGPKSIALLQEIDPSMADIVNFGFFSPIGKVLLVVLKWFYSFIGNWGVAIICLTLLVRAIVLPFNITSYKSMKKMQTIQPMLQSLRERYKEDPTTLNRETMALMKEQKVNPIGGCLPMLLQMPVFFALYQVLGQSIELYQAPFAGWIHDLSLKDPFFVLPVLMGITMFIQQKTTPTTMDPQQAKILQWMPIIFSVFTLSLPAGLTLYIFISTLFGVTQQQLFMRDRSKQALKPVTASAK